MKKTHINDVDNQLAKTLKVSDSWSFTGDPLKPFPVELKDWKVRGEVNPDVPLITIEETVDSNSLSTTGKGLGHIDQAFVAA